MRKLMSQGTFQNIIIIVYEIQCINTNFGTTKQMCNIETKTITNGTVWVLHWYSCHQFYDLIEIIVYPFSNVALIKERENEMIWKSKQIFLEAYQSSMSPRRIWFWSDRNHKFIVSIVMWKIVGCKYSKTLNFQMFTFLNEIFQLYFIHF